jgi:hypothetical protein
MQFLYDLRGNLVFDMDEVLVNIFPIVYAYYVTNASKFKEFISPKKLTEEDMDLINRRQHQDLRMNLLKPEFQSLGESRQLEILRKMRNTKADREFWKSNFYKNLSPTELGRTLMYSSIIDRKEVTSVTILTFSSSEQLNINKQAFVDKYFNHPKIKMVPVNGFGKSGSKIKKSDVMKKLGIDWNVFVDDMPYNIMDFAENFESIKDKLFFMPKFGYNQLSEEQIKYITDKGGIIQYYVP